MHGKAVFLKKCITRRTSRSRNRQAALFFIPHGYFFMPGGSFFYRKAKQNAYPRNIYTMKDEITQIKNMIFKIRGQKVMLDSDLADLYGVEPKVMNQAVKRNIGHFPSDFMFQLTNDEWKALRSQFVTSNNNRGGRRYVPYVFTEQGVSMLSSVINSERAIEVNINIMRTFVKLRQYVLSKSDTNEQIVELRKLLMLYIEKNDKRVNEIIIALNNLIAHPPESKKIGFNVEES
jgi:hypothetical protein